MNLSTGRPDAAGDETECIRRQATDLGLDCLLEIPDELLDPSLVAGLPVEWVRSHGVLPIRWHDGIGLVVTDPADLRRQEDIALLLGQEPHLILAPPAVIAGAIERCFYRRTETAREFLQDMQKAGPAAPAVLQASEDLLRDAEAAPITQLLNLILLEAVKARASDIHFEPFENRLRVRYRVDGVLYEQSSPPKHMELALISRLKVMAHMDIAERRLPQDGMAKVRVGAREIDIRISTVPVAEGERVVLRLLNRDTSLLPLATLGMPESVRGELELFLGGAHGLLIVAGPTGSGKTTTLYAALGRVDTARRNVITIEDPIEYQLPDIGQIQVNPKIGLTFAVGLRHILRQDPDVILVGETRDQETAEIAIRAALTGHLVFTTLHTNDSASAVVRMMDIGVASYLLAAALRGVVAQRLVRKLCPGCRRPITCSEQALAGLGQAARRWLGQPAWQAAGCSACREGYWGRVGVFEMLPLDAAFHEVIRSGQGTASALRATAEQRGFPGMLEDGMAKVVQGLTTLDEVRYVVGQPDPGAPVAAHDGSQR